MSAPGPWRRAGRTAGPVATFAVVWFSAFVGWQLFGWGGEARRTVIGDAAPVVIEVVGLVLAVLASRRSTEQRTARAWAWIAAAFGSYLVGDVIWAFYEVVLEQEPFPSIADAFYLAFYPLLLLGLLSFPTPARSSGERMRMAMDISIVVLSSMMIVWYFALGPTVHDASAITYSTLLSIAYPSADIALMVGLAAVLLRGSDYAISPPLRILVAGLGAFVVADIGFAHLNLDDNYRSGSWPDTFWMLALALMAVSADRQRRDGPRQVGVRRSTTAAQRQRISSLPYLGIGASYGLLLFVANKNSLFPLDGLLVGAASVTAVVVLRQVTALRDNLRLMDEFQLLATTDALTGLPNRRHILDLGAVDFVRSRRDGQPLSVLIADLDHFKTINDTYGHSVGDDALTWMAALLTRMLPAGAVVGRYGGDEFVAVLPGLDLSAALRLARALVDAAAKTEQPLIDGPGHVTLSLGVASADDRPDFDAVLAAADDALYGAKRNGRNQARADTAP